MDVPASQPAEGQPPEDEGVSDEAIRMLERRAARVDATLEDRAAVVRARARAGAVLTVADRAALIRARVACGDLDERRAALAALCRDGAARLAADVRCVGVPGPRTVEPGPSRNAPPMPCDALPAALRCSVCQADQDDRFWMRTLWRHGSEAHLRAALIAVTHAADTILPGTSMPWLGRACRIVTLIAMWLDDQTPHRRAAVHNAVEESMQARYDAGDEFDSTAWWERPALLMLLKKPEDHPEDMQLAGMWELFTELAIAEAATACAVEWCEACRDVVWAGGHCERCWGRVHEIGTDKVVADMHNLVRKELAAWALS
jgi:hypothetical protein